MYTGIVLWIAIVSYLSGCPYFRVWGSTVGPVCVCGGGDTHTHSALCIE